MILSLFQIYCIFALIFVLKDWYEHRLDSASIDYAVSQNQNLEKKHLVTGISLTNAIKVILTQALIFVIFKLSQLIFINLGWL